MSTKTLSISDDGRSYLHQVFSGEQRQAHVFHQVSQVFLPNVFIVVDPGYHRLKNLRNQTQTDKARIATGTTISP